MTPARATALAPADVDRPRRRDRRAVVAPDAATHRFLTLIRRRKRRLATHGALSCAQSVRLAHRPRDPERHAREVQAACAYVMTLPRIDDVLLPRGAVSYAATCAMTRRRDGGQRGDAARNGAQHATASQLERICRGYQSPRCRRCRAAPREPADEEMRRFVRTTETEDGMVRVEGVPPRGGGDAC